MKLRGCLHFSNKKIATNVVKKLSNPSHQENASPIERPNVKADPKIIAKSESLNESQ